MTPEQRRAKHPLAPVTPLSVEEEADLRRRTEEWLARPMFTDRLSDMRHHMNARLLATLDAERDPPTTAAS